MPTENGDSADQNGSAEIALPADLPPEVIELAKENPQVRQAVKIIAEQYRGPIPHPRTLQEFDKIVPGSAKDIFEDFKAWGQLNRNLLERQVNSELAQDTADRNLAFRGQAIATLLIFVFGVPGIIRIFMGDPVGGGLLIAPALLGGLARLFLGSRLPEKDEKPAETPRDEDDKPKP